MIPSAPKFSKIILLLKDKEGKPSDKIEYLESLMNTQPCQLIIDGVMCIHLALDIAATGNNDLINAIENGG